MTLKLVKLEYRYKQQLFDMLDEWYSAGEKIVPYAIRKTDYHDFEKGIMCRMHTSMSCRGKPFLPLPIEQERNVSFLHTIIVRKQEGAAKVKICCTLELFYGHICCKAGRHD